MKWLIQQATIVQPLSPYNALVKDILVDNGKIVAIENSISASEDISVIPCNGAYISNGFVEIFSDFAEPGFEYRETIFSGAKAAIAGGYTTVFTLPNLQPVTQTKTQVEFAIENGKKAGLKILPIGAVSKDIEGKSLADMYDMQQAGAVAFSDGKIPVQSAGLLLKALQYVKAFNGVIIQLPLDKQIGSFGLMNEGVVSTSLGLTGIPVLAETLLLKRDIDLAKYTNSKLHVVGISTKESVQLIQQAKADGIAISCSVTPYHLLFTDANVKGYDTNFKQLIPLRSESDRLALIRAIEDGIIDSVIANHLPLNWDEKNCEFEYAKGGCIGIQTTFNMLIKAMPTITPSTIANLLSYNNQRIFNINHATFEVGSIIDGTIFSTTETTPYTLENNYSKATNNPFIGTVLPGKIIATISGNNVFINN